MRRRKYRSQMEEPEEEPMEEEIDEMDDDHSHPDYEEVMRSLAFRTARMERSLRGYREQAVDGGAANDPLPPAEDTLKVEPEAEKELQDTRAKAIERMRRRLEQLEDEKKAEPEKKLERIRRRIEQLEEEEKKVEEQLEDEEEKKEEDMGEKPIVAPEVAAEKDPESMMESLRRRKTVVGGQNRKLKENLNVAIKKFVRGA